MNLTLATQIQTFLLPRSVFDFLLNLLEEMLSGVQRHRDDPSVLCRVAKSPWVADYLWGFGPSSIGPFGCSRRKKHPTGSLKTTVDGKIS